MSMTGIAICHMALARPSKLIEAHLSLQTDSMPASHIHPLPPCSLLSTRFTHHAYIAYTHRQIIPQKTSLRKWPSLVRQGNEITSTTSFTQERRNDQSTAEHSYTKSVALPTYLALAPLCMTHHSLVAVLRTTRNTQTSQVILLYAGLQKAPLGYDQQGYLRVPSGATLPPFPSSISFLSLHV